MIWPPGYWETINTRQTKGRCKSTWCSRIFQSVKHEVISEVMSVYWSCWSCWSSWSVSSSLRYLCLVLLTLAMRFLHPDNNWVNTFRIAELHIKKVYSIIVTFKWLKLHVWTGYQFLHLEVKICSLLMLLGLWFCGSIKVSLHRTEVRRKHSPIRFEKIPEAAVFDKDNFCWTNIFNELFFPKPYDEWNNE